MQHWSTAMKTADLPSPESMTDEDLLALIAGRYQEAHRQVLPDLIELAHKVEHVHHGAPAAPAGLAAALDHIAMELDMHMQVEERVLFPSMLRHRDSVIAYPLALMRNEHDDYAIELDKIQELAHGFVPPAAACSSWRRLYKGVAELCATLREQIRLENEVLFPRFERAEKVPCTCAHV
jgi:regulator of cell morphogenesis and NO signaling